MKTTNLILLIQKVFSTLFKIKTPFGVIFLNLHFKISREDNHFTALKIREVVVWFGPKASPGVQRIESSGKLGSIGVIAWFRF